MVSVDFHLEDVVKVLMMTVEIAMKNATTIKTVEVRAEAEGGETVGVEAERGEVVEVEAERDKVAISKTKIEISFLFRYFNDMCELTREKIK